MPSQIKRIYLDHAATTPLDSGVFNCIKPYLTKIFGNASSQHSFGREAAEGVTHARDELSVALGAAPSELYFTGSGTEADNLGIKGIALANCQRGRHIIVSAIEHPAVLESAKDLTAGGFEVSVVAPDCNGVVMAAAVERELRTDTVLVAVMSANNETGVIQPVREIYDVVKAHGAYLWCDCVQSAGVLPASRFPADGYALSAHKFYGPKGVGAAVIKRGVRFVRQLSGGHQERGMRGGTTDTPAVVGMAQALRQSLACADEENIRVAALRDEFERLVMQQIAGATVNGAGAERLASHSNISFSGCEGQNIVLLLDMHGVAASTGAACSSGAATPSHVLKAMGLDEERVKSAVRFSFGRENTLSDVRCAVRIVKNVVMSIRGS